MSFYPEFRQQPSKPHQCIHVDSDGNRCGSHAMYNQYTCYHHQSEDMPTVFPNQPFPLDGVQDRASIQIAIGDVLSQLAANTIDTKRASALLYGLQLASSNLPPHPRPARQPAEPAQAKPEDESPAPEREYTIEEYAYFHQTVFTPGFTPNNQPRPASITDQDIIARTNNNRLLVHHRPLKPTFDATGALIAIHQYPHQPDARITPPESLPTLEIGCPVLTPLGRDGETLTLPTVASTSVPCSLTPNPCSPTLPTLQAVAGLSPKSMMKEPSCLRARIYPCRKSREITSALAAGHGLRPA
jgi:hypothetical protein